MCALGALPLPNLAPLLTDFSAQMFRTVDFGPAHE
jgi:hypothetical protein